MSALKLIFLFLCLSANDLLAFEKVVIWGHKLHTHTHSYIHEGFYRGFIHLGYPTYWFNDEEDHSLFDFSNTLFLTEGQVDQRIPLRQDCFYIVHNPSTDKYKEYPSINLQVYTDDCLSRPELIKIAPCHYYDLSGRCVYMPWATDLLPEEIEQIEKRVPDAQRDSKIFWVGTVGGGHFGNKHQLNPFIKACKENEIEFVTMPIGTTREQHIESILHSYMAPSIVGKWQRNRGYIPCRIFKNISYGQMGITNSARVQELFEGRLIYNHDTHQLFYDAQERLQKVTVEEILDLMEIVKKRHTYLNRISTLLEFIDQVKK